MEEINNILDLVNRLIEGNEDMITENEDEHILQLLQLQRDHLEHLKELIKEIKR